ncbi:MAG: hypothetical protein ABWZ42_12340 [Ilumatobacteraceae bacterium]
MTLNEARERAFTGEIVFETDPEVRAYLDNGVAYYAERASSPSLGERLVGASVLDNDQLDRGTVRIGEVENLGRLFDRDPSVDRDAVLVVTEALTDELVMELANEVVTTIRFTAYRHHPSGLHRWFASPVEPTADCRPGMVSSLETSVLDDLPGPGGTPMIDQCDLDRVAAPEPTVDLQPVPGSPTRLVLLDDELLLFDDAAREPDVAEAENDATPMSIDDLTMTPIATFDEEIVAEVPADVADAVQRAIAALEAATVPSPTIAPILQPSDLLDADPAPAAATIAAPPPAFSGFAPPTLESSVEALYARMAAEQDLVVEAPDASEQRVPTSMSPDGEADAQVAVDDDIPASEGEDGGNERSSALRRLIDSLRRKNH